MANRSDRHVKHVLSEKSAIPNAEKLRARLQSLAMMDALLMPEWELRYFSFNSSWTLGKMMASMRDGEGSEFFFLFDESGTVGKIYCRENRVPNTALTRIPTEFSSFLSEPAFNMRQVT